MPPRQLLVFIARGEDPLLTLDPRDHQFVTAMANGMFGPAPRGGHQVLYCNTLTAYQHYRPTADFGIAYFSHRVRADPRFLQVEQALQQAHAAYLPPAHVLAFAMGMLAGKCATWLGQLDGGVLWHIAGARRTAPTAVDRLDALMGACWDNGDGAPAPRIETVSFFQDHVPVHTARFQDAPPHAEADV